MKILFRKEHVEKKPVYCWTASVIVEVSAKDLCTALQDAQERSMNEQDRNNLIWSKCSVGDFEIVHDKE